MLMQLQWHPQQWHQLQHCLYSYYWQQISELLSKHLQAWHSSAMGSMAKQIPLEVKLLIRNKSKYIYSESKHWMLTQHALRTDTHTCSVISEKD